jgi:hypothetical protein
MLDCRYVFIYDNHKDNRRLKMMIMNIKLVPLITAPEINNQKWIDEIRRCIMQEQELISDGIEFLKKYSDTPTSPCPSFAFFIEPQNVDSDPMQCEIIMYEDDDSFEYDITVTHIDGHEKLLVGEITFT